MANQDQVAILKQGVMVWNQWREANLETAVDLSGIDLSRANFAGPVLWDAKHERTNLRGANLSEADLTDAILRAVDLTAANLNGAGLFHAKLCNANLAEANLTEVDLCRADLFRTNLREANLAEADLTEADLRGANLNKTKLYKARLRESNLSEADLTEANLPGANLNKARLYKARLREADLRGANLAEADLTEADLTEADLRVANLRHTDLGRADLSGADLSGADLTSALMSRANLVGAILSSAQLVRTNLQGARLTGCRIYGIAVWDVIIDESTIQTGLIITPKATPDIAVDNLKVAQFIYLILNNEELRDTLNTIHSKVVLILGRFSDERKPALDAMREHLRLHGYIPVMFDFEKSADRSFIDTVSTLASMAHFVVADMTDAKLTMQELQHILAHRATIPVQPLLLAKSNPTMALGDFLAFGSFLEFFVYTDQEHLLKSLPDKVIGLAEAWANDLAMSARSSKSFSNLKIKTADETNLRDNGSWELAQ